MEKVNIMELWASPSDWWFWVLLPYTGLLWLYGALIDLLMS